jgi:hypothetical protein
MSAMARVGSNAKLFPAFGSHAEGGCGAQNTPVRWARHPLDWREDTEKESTMTTITATPVETPEILDDVEDTMDAPADWDSGAVSFDPYI